MALSWRATASASMLAPGWLATEFNNAYLASEAGRRWRACRWRAPGRARLGGPLLLPPRRAS
jgi:hypothetical protein